MEIEGYQFPDDLYYHKEHYWARIENDTVVMGATDFAQKLAGEITYVELPEEGRKVDQDKPCGWRSEEPHASRGIAGVHSFRNSPG